jgi:hypothetical protein
LGFNSNTQSTVNNIKGKNPERIIVDDNGGSNSAITTVKVIDNQESPSVPPKIPEPSISNPGDKSVRSLYVE